MTLSDKDVFRPIIDTVLSGTEQYADFRKFETAAFTTGNLGSAHHLLEYHDRSHILTQIGFNQYDNYKINGEQIKYYKLGRAYNDLSFTPVRGQDNFKVNAKFARNFANNVQLTLDYSRIFQEGFYVDQETKNTALAVSVWKKYPERNHDLFVTFLANNHNEEFNGGITNPQESRIRTSLTPFLQEADGRHQHFTYSIDNYFSLKEKFKAHHQISYDTGFYRYSDDNTTTSNDSLVYRDYIVRNTGIRYFTRFRHVTNTVDLAFKTKGIGVTAGLLYKFQQYTFEEDRRVINDLVGFGDLYFNFSKNLNLSGRIELGLGENVGNLKIDSDLDVNISNHITANAHLNIIRYDASLIEEDFKIIGQAIFDNNFSKINSFRIGGSITVKRPNISVSFDSGIIDNAVGIDTSALFFQSDESIEYIKAKLTQRSQWKFIGLENEVLFQQFTDNIFNLPDLYSTHKLYTEFYLFRRNLRVQTGGVYFNTMMDRGLAFMPVLGRYYEDPNNEFDSFPYVEFFANFEIDDFKLFYKIENLVDFIDNQEHFHALNHPQFDSVMRIGVRWVIRG